MTLLVLPTAPWRLGELLMATPSFFDAYKELFEYEEHVGSEDPVTLSQRDGIGTKTFLDKYCECEQRQALELRAAVPVPFVTTLTVDASRMRPAPLSYSSTGASSSFVSPTMGLSHVAASLSNQHLQHQQLSYEQYSHDQHQAPLKPRPKTPGMSSFTRSRLENSLRQSMSSSNQEDALAAPSTTAPHAPESQHPQHYPNNSNAHNTSPTKPTAAPAPARHQRASTLPLPRQYQAPKLTDLLIDSSTRSATLRHRHVDEAKKIELLIGSNCGGRISAAAATTLPPSIRRRLQASINAPQRREQLYSVLRREYETLCASH